MAERLTLRGDGLNLAASAWGAPTAPSVCFLHGGGQSRRSWARAARQVAGAGYRAIALDLRGHGDSDWSASGDYALDAFARDVEKIVDQLSGDVVLVGASRGGQAALIGGSRRQDRVRLVMLADVVPDNALDQVDAIRRFFRASATGFDDVAAAAAALADYTGRAPPADPSGLRKAMREEDGRLFWHWDPKTVSPQFVSPPSEAVEMAAAARNFRKPLLLVRADHGSLATDDAVERFHALVPQLVVEFAPGSHHMLTGDDNAAFASRLLDHLGPGAGQIDVEIGTVGIAVDERSRPSHRNHRD